MTVSVTNRLAFLALLYATVSQSLPLVTAQASDTPTVGDSIIMLPVNPAGSLGGQHSVSPANCITSAILVRHVPSNTDTFCGGGGREGWGMSYGTGSGLTTCFIHGAGAASTPPPTVLSFAIDATTATSVTQCGTIQVTQVFTPDLASPGLWRDNITLLNAGPGPAPSLRFRRMMSWGSFGSNSAFTFSDLATQPLTADPPSALVESGLAKKFSDSADPTVAPVYWVEGPPGGPNVLRFYQQQSMVWTFNFGTLLPGGRESFTLYYGIAENAGASTSIISAIGANVYGLSYPGTGNPDAGPIGLMAFGEFRTEAPPLPTASMKFSASPDGSGCMPPIQFTDLSTSVYAAVVAWSWEFGDGGSSTDQNPKHAYASPGKYDVRLTVMDENGMSSDYTTTVTIADGDVCSDPGQHDGYSPRPPRDGANEEMADGDADSDGVRNVIDNCPLVANPDQLDTDGDGLGDVCDPDIDNDGRPNDADNCPATTNKGQADMDGDGQGDACDADVDGDTVANSADNCPQSPNVQQEDGNGNGVGDVCDAPVPVAVPEVVHLAKSPASRGAAALARKAETPTWGMWLLIGASLLAAGAYAVMRRRWAPSQETPEKQHTPAPKNDAGLYAGLTRSQLHGHPIRQALVAAIRAKPGILVEELLAKSGCDERIVEHHLAVLEAAGSIRSQGSGRLLGYSLDRIAPSTSSAIVALRPGLARQVAELVARKPGVRMDDLARLLGVPRTSVVYHVRRLDAAGVITVAKDRTLRRIH